MMRIKLKFLFFISILVLPVLSFAQATSPDSLLISRQVRNLEEKKFPGHTVHLQSSYNPVKAFLFLSMYFYQSVLSEQISAGCEFDRSCSNFSLTAIRELGFIKGICLSADRLTRCNGQAQSESYGYLINHSNGKTIDEPSMYRFKD